MVFVDVRHPTTGKLLFRFDPQRDLVQVGGQGQTAVIDLTEYREMVTAGRLPPDPRERLTTDQRRRRGPIR